MWGKINCGFFIDLFFTWTKCVVSCSQIMWIREYKCNPPVDGTRKYILTEKCKQCNSLTPFLIKINRKEKKLILLMKMCMWNAERIIFRCKSVTYYLTWPFFLKVQTTRETSPFRRSIKFYNFQFFFYFTKHQLFIFLFLFRSKKVKKKKSFSMEPIHDTLIWFFVPSLPLLYIVQYIHSL